MLAKKIAQKLSSKELISPPYGRASPLLVTANKWYQQGQFKQQLRWKRKDGHRYHLAERKPTKKDRKEYNRRLKRIETKKETHGTPGSRAGIRREWEAMEKERLLQHARDRKSGLEELPSEYGKEDLFLDSFMQGAVLSEPTPVPENLASKEHIFRSRVIGQVQAYLSVLERRKQGDENAIVAGIPYPSDRDISLAIRGYRDKNGTRRKPVGLVKTLEYVLQELKVPLVAFEEYSFSALLSTCRTPAEGQRVIKLIKEQKQPVSPYHWSILVDIYSKVGDIEGCLAVHRQMLENGCPPNLASFTSLLAACYRIASNGQLPRQVRAEASKTAWNQWKEMRVVGLTPDVMAYGAILRIMAVQGYPERALNILEEMQYSEVKPTSLCYTSALRAVARSHSIAIRYENGTSRKNRRREFLTMHHGKMARKIVQLAEQSEVVQDDAFIAALISCASSAGDLASAKAIYLASNLINNFGTLHPLSSGQDKGQSLLITSGDSMGSDSLFDASTTSVFEKEYGADSRVLSALLHTCATTAASTGMGDIWQGRENDGFLCLNSLRLINARRLPRYIKNDIPGQKASDNLIWDGEDRKYDVRGNKRIGKFQLDFDEEAGSTLDDLDPDFLRFYEDAERGPKRQFQRTSFEDLWEEKYGGRSGSESDSESDEDRNLPLDIESQYVETASIYSTAEKKPKLYFDYETMRWKESTIDESTLEDEIPDLLSTVSAYNPGQLETPDNESMTILFDSETGSWEEVKKTKGSASSAVSTNDPASYDPKISSVGVGIKESSPQLYFDKEKMRWETVPLDDQSRPQLTCFEQDRLNERSTKSNESGVLSESEFQSFFAELKRELEESGESADDLLEDEARELFLSMQDEFLAMSEPSRSNSKMVSDSTSQFDELFDGDTNFVDIRGNEGEEEPHVGDTDSTAVSVVSKFDDLEEFPSGVDSVSFRPEEEDSELSRWKELLPQFSDRRLKRVMNLFSGSLGKPPLIDLVLAVREKLPDFITNTWLKKMSLLTARYVTTEIEAKGLVDVHTLNGYLELETSVGSLSRALEFHRTTYAMHNLEPNEYSDRLVFQMLLDNKRFKRAIVFKRKVEESGRSLDLHGYGSMVDYCSKREQLGDALLAIKECLLIHGSPPSENSLKVFRRLCRNNKIDVVELIGDDPVAWLKEGEAHFKREMSKKGKRDVTLPRNSLIRA